MRYRDLRKQVVEIMMRYRVDRLKSAFRSGRKPFEHHIQKEYSRNAEVDEIIKLVRSNS